MAIRIPTLRKHATGQYFVYWGGKNHYLGTNRKEAEQRYLESLDDRQGWKDEQYEARERRKIIVPTIIEIAEQFMASKRVEVGWACETYYTNHLRRFLNLYGEFRADQVRPAHLQKLKEFMLHEKLMPRTINHDLNAVRTLYNWASGLEMIPPINLKGCKNMPIGPAPDRSLGLKIVQDKISKAPAPVKAWLAVNYLALLRPSEVARCVHKEGEWVDDGVFRLDRGKMDKRVSFKRHCVFSPAAMTWLALCEPVWSCADHYGRASDDRANIRPGRLRHSAAMHLVRIYSAPVADVELLLGHAGGRLRVTYHQPNWRALRQTAALLKL